MKLKNISLSCSCSVCPTKERPLTFPHNTPYLNRWRSHDRLHHGNHPYKLLDNLFGRKTAKSNREWEQWASGIAEVVPTSKPHKRVIFPDFSSEQEIDRVKLQVAHTPWNVDIAKVSIVTMLQTLPSGRLRKVTDSYEVLRAYFERFCDKSEKNLRKISVCFRMLTESHWRLLTDTESLKTVSPSYERSICICPYILLLEMIENIHGHIVHILRFRFDFTSIYRCQHCDWCATCVIFRVSSAKNAQGSLDPQ